MMRPLADVPRPVLLLLAAALAAQLGWRAPADPPGQSQLHAPPSGALLRAASLGEPAALAKALMLAVQSADGATPLARLDYVALRAWLEHIAALDPRSRYVLVAASGVYAAAPDGARVRLMLDLVHRQFVRDPELAWPYLAHAALIARHRLHDLPLALRYARAIRTGVRPAVLPAWALQMEAFILEDMHEFEAARTLIGALVASGQVHDPNELRFLERRLDALAKRAGEPMR